MRALAGVIYPDRFQTGNFVPEMLHLMQHRSLSDEKAIHLHKNIHMGCLGGTIATNEKRHIYAMLDGSFSNHQILHQTLTNAGYQIDLNDHTALVVKGYEYWGKELFQHLEGSFALAILDQNKERLILCRDRVGKKPLYWFRNDHYFLFSSELKALLATGAVPQAPALDGLSSYLYFGFIPQDMTPIAGVNKLLPAHYLQLEKGGRQNISSYWSYSTYFSLPSNKEPIEIEKILSENLKNSLPKGQPIGCVLGFPPGSEILTNSLEKVVEKELLSLFSIGLYQEEDTFPQIRKIEKAHNLPNFNETLTQENFLNDLLSIVWHLDEPIADPSVTTLWRSLQFASRTHDVIVSDLGSNALFGGENRHHYQPLQEGFESASQVIQRLMIPILKAIYPPLALKFLKESRTSLFQYRYMNSRAVMRGTTIEEASPLLGPVFDPEVFLHKFHHLERVPLNSASHLYFDVKTRLPDHELLLFDRIAGAHGLEWHAPFLDHSIVEAAARMQQNPHFGAHQGNFPRSWLVSPHIKKLLTYLKTGTLVESGIVSLEWLEEGIRELEFDPISYRYFWSLLILEIWYRFYINLPMERPPTNLSLEEFLEQTL